MRLLTTSNELARMATLNTMLGANSLFCETAIAAELKARYKLLSRRAMDLVLDDAIVNPSVKIAAIHGGLAATRNQVKFSQGPGNFEACSDRNSELLFDNAFRGGSVLK